MRKTIPHEFIKFTPDLFTVVLCTFFMKPNNMITSKRPPFHKRKILRLYAPPAAIVNILEEKILQTAPRHKNTLHTFYWFLLSSSKLIDACSIVCKQTNQRAIKTFYCERQRAKQVLVCCCSVTPRWKDSHLCINQSEDVLKWGYACGMGVSQK